MLGVKECAEYLVDSILLCRCRTDSETLWKDTARATRDRPRTRTGKLAIYSEYTGNHTQFLLSALKWFIFLGSPKRKKKRNGTVEEGRSQAGGEERRG